jgi:hypothetical protein
MAAGEIAPTIPFCGSCGYDHEARNINGDQLCDACGAEVSYYGFSTVATAGIPGSFDGGTPSDLAGLITTGVIASPLTAWTTGQSVDLGDASEAHWDDSAWVVGAAA